MVRLAVRSRPLSSRAIAAKSRMATLGDVAESAAKSDVVNARHASSLSVALSERWSELAMRVATTPAKTMEGLIAKIALIASGYAEDDLDGTYDGILASAALDAQALANARGAGAA